MTGFDLLLVAVIVASTLLALVHGFIKEVIALAAWILGIGFALLFTNTVGHWMPDNLFGFPHLRFVIAFICILVLALVIGAVLSSLLKSGAKAIGLGALDRLLGGIFGMARGIVIAMVVVLLIASTSYASEPWYQRSALVPHLRFGALVVRDQLPPDWQTYLDRTLQPALPPQPVPASPARPGQQKT